MSVPNRSSRIADPFDRFEQTLPKIPEPILEKIPELRTWQTELENWYEHLRQVIETNQQVMLAKIQELDR